MAGSRNPEAPFQIAQVDGADASDLFVHAIPAPAAQDDQAQTQRYTPHRFAYGPYRPIVSSHRQERISLAPPSPN